MSKSRFVLVAFSSLLEEPSSSLKSNVNLCNNLFSGPVWQVPAQVSAAWEGGADNHYIIPLSGPAGLNSLPREHSGGLEKIARKYGKHGLHL